MFDKFKQLSQLKSVQDELKKEMFEVSRNGIKVVVSGGLNVAEISSERSLNDGDIDLIKDLVNDALSKAQRGLAGKLMNMNLNI